MGVTQGTAYTASAESWTDMTQGGAIGGWDYKDLVVWQWLDNMANNEDRAEGHLHGIGTGVASITNPHGQTLADISSGGGAPYFVNGKSIAISAGWITLDSSQDWREHYIAVLFADAEGVQANVQAPRLWNDNRGLNDTITIPSQINYQFSKLDSAATSVAVVNDGGLTISVRANSSNGNMEIASGSDSTATYVSLVWIDLGETEAS